MRQANSAALFCWQAGRHEPVAWERSRSMAEKAKPDQDDDAAQSTDDTAQDDASEEAEAPEVVAHSDDGAELPWCIGYVT
jgi:hypothetical protein